MRLVASGAGATITVAVSALSVVATGGVAARMAYLAQDRSQAAMWAMFAGAVVGSSWIAGLFGAVFHRDTTSVFLAASLATGAGASFTFAVVYTSLAIYVVPDYSGDIWLVGGITLLSGLGVGITMAASVAGAVVVRGAYWLGRRR